MFEKVKGWVLTHKMQAALIGVAVIGVAIVVVKKMKSKKR